MLKSSTYTEYYNDSANQFNAWSKVPGIEVTSTTGTAVSNTAVPTQLADSTREYILLETEVVATSVKRLKVSLVTIDSYTLETTAVTGRAIIPAPNRYVVTNIVLEYVEVLGEMLVYDLNIGLGAADCALFPADNCNGFAGFFNCWSQIHQFRLKEDQPGVYNAYIYTTFRAAPSENQAINVFTMEFKFNTATQNIEFQGLLKGRLYPPLTFLATPAQLTSAIYSADNVRLVI